MDEVKDIVTSAEQTDTEKIAQSYLPYNRDDSRARYLGLRSSGFTIREALQLIQCHHSTLSKWRTNSQFVQIENDLPKYRKELALEYANLEFLRNYRLVLEKDYRVLQKSLNPETAVLEGVTVTLPLAQQEQEYLIKLRTHYTPQQLQIISSLMTAKDGKGEEFNFTDFVLTASKIEQRVRVEGRLASKTMQPLEIIEGEKLDG